MESSHTSSRLGTDQRSISEKPKQTTTIEMPLQQLDCGKLEQIAVTSSIPSNGVAVTPACIPSSGKKYPPKLNKKSGGSIKSSDEGIEMNPTSTTFNNVSYAAVSGGKADCVVGSSDGSIGTSTNNKKCCEHLFKNGDKSVQLSDYLLSTKYGDFTAPSFNPKHSDSGATLSPIKYGSQVEDVSGRYRVRNLRFVAMVLTAITTPACPLMFVCWLPAMILAVLRRRSPHTYIMSIGLSSLIIVTVVALFILSYFLFLTMISVETSPSDNDNRYYLFYSPDLNDPNTRRDSQLNMNDMRAMKRLQLGSNNDYQDFQIAPHDFSN